eukprot:scaffold11019_cov166-Isochrysis_galbana.AAC.2
MFISKHKCQVARWQLAARPIASTIYISTPSRPAPLLPSGPSLPALPGPRPARTLSFSLLRPRPCSPQEPRHGQEAGWHHTLAVKA